MMVARTHDIGLPSVCWNFVASPQTSAYTQHNDVRVPTARRSGGDVQQALRVIIDAKRQAEADGDSRVLDEHAARLTMSYS